MSVWRATLTWLYVTDQVIAQNVLHMLDPSGTMTHTQVGSIIENQWWGSAAGLALRAMTIQNVTLNSIQLQRVDTTPPGGVLPYNTLKQGGGVVGTFWHEVVGFVFSIYDGGAGPAHRGRIYHFGTPSNANTRVGPSASNQNSFNLLRDDWLNKFGELPTSNLHWVIWHRGKQGDERWTKIKDIRLSPRFGIQRRRNPGVGM
jgi:hypothetical protein